MYKKIRWGVLLVLLVVFSLTQYFAVFQFIDNTVHDNFMASGREPHSNIIIVGIDERSINEIGVWPWPRLYVAEAINSLYDMGAAVIGVNVLYTTVGAHPEYDQLLVDAAIRVGDRLVLAGEVSFSQFQEDTDLLEIDSFILPFGRLGQVANTGFTNAIPDPSDGVMRRSVTSFIYGDITVHSLPFEIYRAYRRVMGQEPVRDIPLDSYGQFPIRYVGGPQTFRSVSLWGVINNEYPAAMFRDAIVLIGPFTGGIEADAITTPLERSFPTHMVEMQANVVQNFLEGVFLTDAPWWLNLIILLVFAAAIAFAAYKLKPGLLVAVTVAMLLVIVLGSRIVFVQFDTIVRVGDTIVFLVMAYLASLVIGILEAQNDKQEIRALFGRFVAPEVVNEILAGGADIQLGGVVKEITALFVDIRGFTAFSEANPPERVVEMINRYLELTSRSIQTNNGTIDKFIGDATMALFNAPNDVKDHALCAVRAAWAMKVGSKTLREEILNDYGVDLQFGVGVNTGPAVVGNMGSDFRMDYTAIGDTINTAARLESNAQKGQIVISDATYQLVKDFVEVEEMGEVKFKNKSIGILTYSVIDVK